MSKDIIRATAARVREAAERLRDYVVRTPLRYSQAFSGSTGADVWFKLENLQDTGSFKLRGATNRLLTLSQQERAAGCVAASSGNHGAAVACAMQKLSTTGIVFVPEQTSPAKVDKIRAYGGDVRFFGHDGLDTEQHARDYAASHDMLYLSPYNDEEVVAGQGTCGAEITQQLPDVDTVLIAVGGGGLIGGCGAVLRAHNPGVRIIGCQPAASPVMARSIEAGEILDLPSEPTLSDGTAGGIESGSVTFPLNQAVVDEFVTVSEAEIASAMRHYMEAEGQVIEGAAGVAVAALLKRRQDLAGEKVVVVICGANVSDETLAAVRGDPNR